MFSSHEDAFLREMTFGRFATVDDRGQPHVVPVRYRYEAAVREILVGGFRLTRTKKFRDVMGNERVALVVDEIVEGANRAVEIRGRAEVRSSGGERIRDGFEPTMLVLHAERVVSWGLDQHVD